MIKSILSKLILGVCALVSHGTHVGAQTVDATNAAIPKDSPFGSVESYLDFNTLAVARWEPAKLGVEFIRPLAQFANSQSGNQDWLPLARELCEAKVEEVFVVFSLSDTVDNQVPLVVISKPGSLTLPDVEKILKANQWEFKAKSEGNTILIARQRVFDRMQKQPRGEFNPLWKAAFSALDSAEFQLCFALSDDHRRVIEELHPKLPAPLGSGPSAILTQGIHWMALSISTTSERAVALTFQSKDNTAAGDFHNWLIAQLKNLPGMLDSQPMFQPLLPIVAQLSPTLSGDRVSISLNGSDQVDSAAAVIVQPLTEASMRQETSWKLREIALSMHNYADTTRGALPAIGSKDADGRPLLSWRVHVLPFLEHHKLYSEFHLDEAWDSPHNRELIAKMPKIFRHPKSNSELAEGKCNFCIPQGNGAITTNLDQTKFTDVTDGTSNTIMLVEVDDEHAEIWTKPSGWTFDPKNPSLALGGHFPGDFISAFVDGSVRALPLDHPNLAAFFTRAGGEVIELPK